MEGSNLATGTASGLKGNIPDFEKPSFMLVIENARSNGVFNKTLEKSCFERTKSGFENAKARTTESSEP